MTSLRIKRITAFQRLAVVALVLALALSSQAVAGQSSKGAIPGKPLVSTGSASHVTGASATLAGTVNPRTLATTYYFQYGPTTTYGSQTTPSPLSAGTATVKVSKLATPILLGYHYRLVATNADGTSLGHDHTLSPTKATKAAFTLPKLFQPTPLGGAFLLKGVLTGPGNVNRQIVLQSTPYPYIAPYTNVGAPISTGAGGVFAFRVPSLTTSTKFRVSRVGTPALYSLIVPERVSVRVTLKVRSSSRKGLVRLYGTVTPSAVGAHVFFQLEKPPKSEQNAGPKAEKPIRPEKPGKGGGSRGGGGRPGKSEAKGPTFVTKFSTIAKRGTRSISRFSAVVNVSTTGHYRAFVEIPPGALVSGRSSSLLLHAAPNPKAYRKKEEEVGSRAALARDRGRPGWRQSRSALDRDKPSRGQHLHHAVDLLLDGFFAATDDEIWVGGRLVWRSDAGQAGELA